MNRRTAYGLYACHALSTWNARSYEFAAIIFTAAAYPGGLRATSFIGITTSVAAICFASHLGHWIDTAPSRFRTLITTIVVNRGSAIVACLFWFFIVTKSSSTTPASSILEGIPKDFAFATILILGVVENLSRRANVLSMERDWVPILAPPSLSGTEQRTLAQVNSVMARIDIACKLLAPIAISGFGSVVQIRVVVASMAAIGLLGFIFEILSAWDVWNQSDVLRKPKLVSFSTELDLETRNQSQNSDWTSKLAWIGSFVDGWWTGWRESFRTYFLSEVWIPSFSMTMTQSSILSVSGVLTVFLLNSGYSLKSVTIAEALSALFELSSTFVTPVAVARLSSSRPSHSYELAGILETEDQDIVDGAEEEEFVKGGAPTSNLPEAPSHSGSFAIRDPISKSATRNTDLMVSVSKVGFWGIAWMFVTLVPTLPLIMYLTSTIEYPVPPGSSNISFISQPFASALLLLCLASSRLGRGTFSLTTQQLSQSQVPESHRSNFGGTEIVFVSIFGLSHNIGAAVFSQPRQFGWLAFGSVLAIGASAAFYWWWTRTCDIEVGVSLLRRRAERYTALDQDSEL